VTTFIVTLGFTLGLIAAFDTVGAEVPVVGVVACSSPDAVCGFMRASFWSVAASRGSLVLLMSTIADVVSGISPSTSCVSGSSVAKPEREASYAEGSATWPMVSISSTATNVDSELRNLSSSILTCK